MVTVLMAENEILQTLASLDKKVALLTEKLGTHMEAELMTNTKISESFVRVNHALYGNAKPGVIERVNDLEGFKDRCVERRKQDKRLWFAIFTTVIGLIGKIIYDGWIYMKLFSMDLGGS